MKKNIKFAAPRILSKKSNDTPPAYDKVNKPEDFESAEAFVKSIMDSSNVNRQSIKVVNELLEVVEELRKPSKMLNFKIASYVFDDFTDSAEVVVSKRLKDKQSSDESIERILSMMNKYLTNSHIIADSSIESSEEMKTDNSQLKLNPSIFMNLFGKSTAKNDAGLRSKEKLFDISEEVQESDPLQKIIPNKIDFNIKKNTDIQVPKKTSLDIQKDVGADYDDLDQQEVQPFHQEFASEIKEESDIEEDNGTTGLKSREEFATDEEYRMYVEAQKYKSKIQLNSFDSVFLEKKNNSIRKGKDKQDFKKVKEIMKRKFGTDLDSNPEKKVKT